MPSEITLNYVSDQKYSDLIADAQYNNENLFEDPCFEAGPQSLFLNPKTYSKFCGKHGEIKWLRPKEILEGKQEPKFFKDGASFNEVAPPEGNTLCNAEFMKALAGITLLPTVMDFVCPEQSFADNYRGIFRFRFWRYGKWIEVVIDDRLPTIDGKLVFSRSVSEDEFWVSLMEKALAKLLVRYEAMDCTFEIPEALLDLSGGTVEKIKLAALTIETLCDKLKIYMETGSLVTATAAYRPPGSDFGLKNIDSMYIISGSVKKVMYENNAVNLVRILSTGRHEWTGPWGDESKEMKSLSAETKAELGITSEVDGDFWMDIEDVLQRFFQLKILHIHPQLSEKDTKWSVVEYHNKWQQGTTAMGSLENNAENFHKNPQYPMKVKGEGDLVIASLIQTGEVREESAWEDNDIGLDVYKYEEGQTIDGDFIRENKPVSRFGYEFGFVREIALCMVLEHGNYVIIPSTYKSVDAPFLLRIFSGSSSQIEK